MKSDYDISALKSKYKKIIIIATSLCLLIGVSVLLLPPLTGLTIFKWQTTHKSECCDQILGASEIYPSVMYHGAIYEWDKISVLEKISAISFIDNPLNCFSINTSLYGSFKLCIAF
jgi:hypothetical protein